jgi:hypothetical protein
MSGSGNEKATRRWLSNALEMSGKADYALVRLWVTAWYIHLPYTYSLPCERINNEVNLETSIPHFETKANPSVNIQPIWDIASPCFRTLNTAYFSAMLSGKSSYEAYLCKVSVA